MEPELPVGTVVVVPEINQEDWKLYQRIRGKNLISYVYGYRIPLESHGITNSIFESVMVPEFKQFEGGETYIMIRAKAVQTEGCLTLDDAAEKLGIKMKIEQTTIKA